MLSFSESSASNMLQEQVALSFNRKKRMSAAEWHCLLRLFAFCNTNGHRFNVISRGIAFLHQHCRCSRRRVRPRRFLERREQNDRIDSRTAVVPSRDLMMRRSALSMLLSSSSLSSSRCSMKTEHNDDSFTTIFVKLRITPSKCSWLSNKHSRIPSRSRCWVSAIALHIRLNVIGLNEKAIRSKV